MDEEPMSAAEEAIFLGMMIGVSLLGWCAVASPIILVFRFILGQDWKTSWTVGILLTALGIGYAISKLKLPEEQSRLDV